jgi:hypothetical protein
MKYVIGIFIIVATILAVLHFDSVVIFLLSGTFPGFHFSLSPSIMLAVMLSGALTTLLLTKRREVYAHCLALYDHFAEKDHKQDDRPAKKKTPRRRYEQL